MVGTKPNAYLSEEARLEAQRRMLAERYGLLSDESDDNESGAEEAGNQGDANGLSNGNSNGNGTEHVQPNGQPPPDRAEESTSAVAEDPAPSEAATYGEGSSVHDGDLATILSQDDVAATDASTVSDEKPAPPKRSSDGPAPGWPGVELTDTTGRIVGHFEYSATEQRDAMLKRDLRVTPITVYASQFLEKHRRKIAVNDQIITYAVGGHIRAILRNCTVRALLKGHDSAVADIEFLGHEKRLDETTNDSISVLGSVAEDGSVYVWKIVRNDSDAENDTLEVADAIRFEHPEISDKRSYNRISFRPGSGSIIAEKGIGVAMILIDAESPDVRLVELVKMNEKMMVRDKFLRAQKELEGGADKDAKAPIDSAAWLSERMVATSRCGKVYLWNTDGTLATCIAKLPREKTSKVSSLHALNQEALLVVVDSGRELEVWVAAGFAPDVDTASLELRQTIKLISDDTADAFSVTSVDPFEELVMLSNVKGSSFFVMHFNRLAQAFDSITEVPVKQPILSVCMTRNVRRAPTQGGSSQVLNAEPIEEVGLWCVQPRGISLIHLPARDCSPKKFVKSEVYPKSTQKTVMKKVERIPPPVGVPVTGTSTGPSIPPMPLAPPAAGSVGRNITSSGRPIVVQGRGTTPSSATSVTGISTPADSKKNTPASAQAGSVPSTHVQGLSSGPSDPPPNADEIVNTILEAAKKAVESFEKAGNQRSNAEKSKSDRLVDSVSNTAKANLERFVNSSMKKILAETMIPGMSKIIADTRAAMKQVKVDPKVTTAYFEAALEKSSINDSFAKACQEMERQVTASVTQSMSSKYEALISPTIASVNDAAEDLAASLKLLRQKMSEMGPAENKAAVVEIGPEDIRKTIEEEIGRGNIDGAFQTALDKEDVSLVVWLCSRFDSSTFFELHTLSQISLLSLANQLGHGLSDDDVEVKVEWLRELMLVLEPESEEIDEIAQPTVRQLLENVGELRRNKALLSQHGGLEKSLKTLGRLIASHIPM